MICQKIFNKYIFKISFVKQFIKFCIVGGTSALISFTIYCSTVEYFGWWYVYSSVLGFVISAVFNFIANKLWTFKNKQKGKMILDQAIKFSVVVMTGLLINTSIIYFLTENFKVDYRISWLGACGIVSAWNFTFNRFWTFKIKEIAEILD